MQLYVPSLGRYLLPLPKLTDFQTAALSDNLGERGFDVRRGGRPGRLVVRKGTQRIAVDGGLGLARSGGDMLDALGPSMPSVLASRGPGRKRGADVSALYLSLKPSGASRELQFFPRMESLRTWTCLRRDGMCGLTPDEAWVLKHLLAKAPGSYRVECVTARPRKGSTTIQAGRRLYYKSAITVEDFLSSLRTIDSESADSASYLPRDSVMELPRVGVDGRIEADELGEWCYAG